MVCMVGHPVLCSLGTRQSCWYRQGVCGRCHEVGVGLSDLFTDEKVLLLSVSDVVTHVVGWLEKTHPFVGLLGARKETVFCKTVVYI